MLTAAILLFSTLGPKGLLGPRLPQRALLAAPTCGPTALAVNPATVSFRAVDPDQPVVAGNALATVTWQGVGQPPRPWHLSLQSDGVSFDNCSEIPATAVVVSCSNATVNGGGSAVCGATAPLSHGSRIVASGQQSASNASYQVNLSFTLSDSWKYVAQTNPPCSLTLTYTVDFQ